MAVLIRNIKKIPLNDTPPGPVAFVELEIDGAWVLRDVRIVQQADGTLSVFMPYQKRKYRCLFCGDRQAFDAKFCSECGKPLSKNEAKHDVVYFDTFFALSRQSRYELEDVVVAAYQEAETCQTTLNS